jgi:midasin
LKALSRAVSLDRAPVLLQGETSVGKTSLVSYLAQITGHRCLRINNHEHTDLQEYLGQYVVGTDGQLTFKEGMCFTLIFRFSCGLLFFSIYVNSLLGALVEAMRKGHWVILDELNLAPSDVLEALNRVLDDNRELFIPETQTLVQAHPRFMLFATQNPPGLYGGRKVSNILFFIFSWVILIYVCTNNVLCLIVTVQSI